MPPETADVSVIIPAWRAAVTIGRALASVAVQTVQPREVIVVDDGSDDGTTNVAETSAAALNIIGLTALRRPHLGPGAARNAGLVRAQGTYVAFLDADDEWLPEKLARSLTQLEGNDAALVSHDMIAVAPDGHETYFDCARHFPKASDPFLALFKRGFVATSTVVAQRQVLLDIGGFDPSLPAAQDYDLWLALVAHGKYRIHVFPDALVRHFLSPSGITARVEHRRRCSMTVLRRYAPSLRSRPDALRTVATRTLIVHYEAAAAHWRRGDHASAIAAIFKLWPALPSAFAALRKAEHPRPRYVSQEGRMPINEQQDTARSRGQRWRAIGGLLWVGSVIASYYAFNWKYYTEKIAVFGRFLLG
jgi:GT2 family glycosyltransferase